MKMTPEDRARAEELMRQRFEAQQREAIGRIVIGRACLSPMWTRDNAFLASTSARAKERGSPTTENLAARAMASTARIMGIRPDLELMLAATKREETT